MAQKEAKREDGIDFVSIVTPNATPVSYTHLDVYKRQMMSDTRIMWNYTRNWTRA